MNRILYLCDRKACEKGCNNPECKHTSDINHAVNFERVIDRSIEYFVENEQNSICDDLYKKALEELNHLGAQKTEEEV